MTALFAQADSRPRPLVLSGVSWKTYEALLEEIGQAGQKLFLTYDQGRLEIMAPSPFHEKYKALIGRLIELMCLELDIPISNFGSMTCKREGVARGLEPDNCYYIQNQQLVGTRFELDLSIDPPPDLAIEMDYSPHALDRDSIYSQLGVPEIWTFDGQFLRGIGRNADGQYEPLEYSRAFPFLRLSDVERFLRMAPGTNDNDVVKAFRDWVRSWPVKPS